MDETQIKTLVSRLSRPHPSGGVVIERAALLASGSDFPAVMQWIVAHSGTPDTTPAAPKRRGLHGGRLHEQDDARAAAPTRYLLPAGVAE